MEREHIDSIATQAVRDAVWAYEEFYYLDRPKLGMRADRRARICGCGPHTGEWPNNHMEVGGRVIPAICEAHEWASKRQQLQTAITVSGLSMPIPLRTKRPAPVEKLRAAPVHTHPLDAKPYYWEPSKPLGNISGDVAGAIARWLCESDDPHSREHVVFYANRSQLLSLVFSHKDQAVRDLIMYAPVLVYLQSEDGRSRNCTWISDLVYSRQYGLTFVIKT